jgi:AraC family transcriptional regulator, regulatory protein of adaptative response / methylated-DNA-[protein]-cysteine methyltransferase
MDAIHRRIIRDACHLLDSADPAPNLATLARRAGLSPWYFQRLFTAGVGLSPKRYAIAKRQARLATALKQQRSITTAIYDAGYAASSSAYRDSRHLGMTPRSVRDGGQSELIRYAAASTSLGQILVAATDRGICMVEFGATSSLVAQLQQRFPKAQLQPANASLTKWVEQVVSLIDDPASATDLPLDIRGTAFQIRVWRALIAIKPGNTVSYAQLARKIRAPKSARAVARACATNSVAVVVPCHRVISSTGDLAGYKWGINRKRRLLARETALAHRK